MSTSLLLRPNYNGTGATRSAAQKRFTATNNNPTVKTTFVRIVTMKIDTARGTFSRSEILTYVFSKVGARPSAMAKRKASGSTRSRVAHVVR